MSAPWRTVGRYGKHTPAPVANLRWRPSPTRAKRPRRAPNYADKAAFAARLAHLAEWLPDDERALVCSIFAQGRAATQIAQLQGVPVQRVRRTVRAVTRRMLRPEFIYVALNRALWDALTAGVASLCILQGRSVRETAHRLGVSVHTVRQYRAAVLALSTLGTKAKEHPCSDPAAPHPPSPPRPIALAVRPTAAERSVPPKC